MPEVPAFNGDLSVAARLIYGDTIPAHARYAAMTPTTLSLRGRGRPLIFALIGFLMVNAVCTLFIIAGGLIFAGQETAIDPGSIIGFVACTFVPFAIVGLVLMVAFGGRFAGRLTGKRTGSEACRISNDKPRPGESIDVNFDLGFQSEMEVTGTTIQLLRRETVTYTAGTDRHTVSHDVVIDSQQFMGRTAARQGDFLTENASFTLPADAMHTFIANRNKILWLVKVSVAIKGRPDINNLYHLIVVPDLSTEHSLA